MDVSIPGCLLESPDRVKPGDYMQLRLFLPDHPAPLHIPLAAVRWVEGFRFGVEFIRTAGDAQLRLARYVERRLQAGQARSQWSEGITLIGWSDC